MKNNDLNDFYLYLIGQKKIKNKSDFAIKLGYGRQYATELLNGTKDITEEFENRVKNIFKDEWKLFDLIGISEYERRKLSVTEDIIEYNTENKNAEINENGFIYTRHPDGIPALPIRVQGGFSLHYNDPIFWKQLERIYIPGLPFKGDKFLWAEMEGDSMEYIDEETGRISGIRDRQWCLYEMVPKEFWKKGLRKYYVHLVITDTIFTVKRILQDNEDEIVLSPDNEMYDQERVHLSNVQGIYIFKRKLDWNAPPPRRHEIKV